MALFGSLGKFLGKGLKGVSKAAGIIPGLGPLAGGALGGLGEIMEKGRKVNLKGFAGSTAGGALSGLLGGIGGKVLGGGGGGGGIGGFLKNALGGLGDGKLFGGGGEGGGGGLAKLLGLGLGGAQMYGDYKQSKKDSKYSRQLAEEALGSYRQASQMAQDRWAEQSPLREAFNFGAFNMSDPTNPFSRNIFGGMGPQAPGQGPATMRTDTEPGQMAPNGLMAMVQNGGRTPGSPTMRSASVKSGRNAQAQDRGRDRMRDDQDERMAY
jgi:hypothetical protein